MSSRVKKNLTSKNCPHKKCCPYRVGPHKTRKTSIHTTHTWRGCQCLLCLDAFIALWLFNPPVGGVWNDCIRSHEMNSLNLLKLRLTTLGSKCRHTLLTIIAVSPGCPFSLVGQQFFIQISIVEYALMPLALVLLLSNIQSKGAMVKHSPWLYRFRPSIGCFKGILHILHCLHM